MALGVVVAPLGHTWQKALRRIKSQVGAGIICFLCLGAVTTVGSANWPEQPLIERLQDGSRMGLTRLTSELRGSPFVLMGELHDEQDHHRAQLMLIRVLWEAKVPLAIGMEMFRQDAQESLDRWVRGEMPEEEMEEIFSKNWAESSWVLYREILRFARDKSIPVLGLNLPREVTQKVASSGYASLPEEMRKEWGDVSCDPKDPYKSFLLWAFEAHEAHKDGQWENFCQAQILWDTAMAVKLLDFREKNPETTVVVLTGIAHAWVHGIPERIRLRSYLLCRVILPEVQGRLKEERVGVQDADYLWLRY